MIVEKKGSSRGKKDQDEAGLHLNLNLNGARWATEREAPLVDFVRRFPIPHLALVTDGHWEGADGVRVGAAGLGGTSPFLYLHCKRVLKKLAGQLVRLANDGRTPLSVTNTVVCVSDAFKGYFEILSEDGKPARQSKCVESVASLSEQLPEMILMRKDVKCYVADGADGELGSLRAKRILRAGQVLTLVGRFHARKRTYLRCFDESGSSVFLKLSQNVECSRLATGAGGGGGDVAGVQDVGRLMNMRLPLTVRLVHGAVSRRLDALRGSQPLVLRLRKLFKQDVVLAYSIDRPIGRFFALPVDAPLKVAPSRLDTHEQYDSRRLADWCDRAADDAFSDRIDLVDDQRVLYDQDQCQFQQRPHRRDHSTSQNRHRQHYFHTFCNATSGDAEIERLYDCVRGADRGRQYHSQPPPPPPPPLRSMPRSRGAGAGAQSPITYEQQQRSEPRRSGCGSSTGGSVGRTPPCTWGVARVVSSTADHLHRRLALNNDIARPPLNQRHRRPVSLALDFPAPAAAPAPVPAPARTNERRLLRIRSTIPFEVAPNNNNNVTLLSVGDGADAHQAVPASNERF